MLNWIKILLIPPNRAGSLFFSSRMIGAIDKGRRYALKNCIFYLGDVRLVLRSDFSFWASGSIPASSIRFFTPPFLIVAYLRFSFVNGIQSANLQIYRKTGCLPAATQPLKKRSCKKCLLFVGFYDII